MDAIIQQRLKNLKKEIVSTRNKISVEQRDRFQYRTYNNILTLKKKKKSESSSTTITSLRPFILYKIESKLHRA